jgi:competence protein ComGF
MIISMVLPVFFFATQVLRQEVEKQIVEQRLRGEYLSFLSFAQRELKTGTQFRTDQGALLFELSTGETVRYEQKSSQIIRQVKQVDSPRFQGHTILLQYVDQVFFTPDAQGVTITVHLKNKKVVSKMETYIAARESDEK